MNSIEVNNITRSRIDLSLIKKVTQAFLKNYKIKNKEVSIALVGDKRIKDLNKAYRSKDQVTDVLAFPGEDEFLGEIIINYAQIKRQAKKFSKCTREELIFILVHGLLHLLGYTDKTENDREKMLKLAENFIKYPNYKL
ncbi:rRNA maturation RNase YbeY [Patescibacteria group bacterium]